MSKKRQKLSFLEMLILPLTEQRKRDPKMFVGKGALLGYIPLPLTGVFGVVGLIYTIFNRDITYFVVFLLLGLFMSVFVATLQKIINHFIK